MGSVEIGGEHPARVQSMLTSDTMDTQACIEETLPLVEAGCEIIRITAPTVKAAANLEHIRNGLLERGYKVPLVADIHFKPEAAMEAAKWVEKVRINPGNYADSKKFAVREYSDSEYAAELERIRERFTPLVIYCRDHGIAMRIGTNHGSLSDRIMNRYGDTPLGMVESALEFARIARENDFHAFVFSMKSSNPKIMIEAYRLLVARLNNEGADWNYPIHLGVTEAGNAEDGRIKSAIGIGTLLSDGIGDTIRVSLTEDSIHEIPVAFALRDFHFPTITRPPTKNLPGFIPNPFSYRRRLTRNLSLSGVPLGGTETIRVVARKSTFDALAGKFRELGDCIPEIFLEQPGITEIDPRNDAAIAELEKSERVQLVTLPDGLDLPVLYGFRLLAARLSERHPILLKDTLTPATPDENSLTVLLRAGVHIGALLCDGIGDAVLIQGEKDPKSSILLAYNTLQAAGARIFKTEYVACPSCGRTLFNLQETTARIKKATAHLKGLKIGVMGCIVNGPGEMADSDFGYVGGAPGKINLYVGKKPVKFNIPQEEAVERLKDLIKEHGRWVDPPEDV